MRITVLAILALSSCATATSAVTHQGHRRVLPPRPPQRELVQRPLSSAQREHIVRLAQSLLGRTTHVVGGTRYPNDCSGFVLATYSATPLHLRAVAEAGDNMVTTLYRHAWAYGKVYNDRAPAPGDLVFFRDTYDANGDGQLADGLTHVGVVEAVESNDTVVFIHRAASGVVRGRLNIYSPHMARAEDGRVLNDMLRTASSKGRSALTGELFVAYGSMSPALSVAGAQ